MLVDNFIQTFILDSSTETLIDSARTAETPYELQASVDVFMDLEGIPATSSLGTDDRAYVGYGVDLLRVLFVDF